MKLLKNSLYSLLAAVLPTVVSIATVPLYITAIGAERYGVLTIAWLVLGYFGASDFGIGRAITQRISAMRHDRDGADADADRPLMASAVWSALFSTIGFGGIGALLVLGFSAWYFSGPFEVGEGLRAEILAALWLLALCNPLTAIAGVLGGALMGLERFRLVAIANLVGNSALLLFPLAAAWFYSVEVSVLIAASLAARLLSMAMLAAGVWLTILRGQRITFSTEEFRRLANFGAWIMVTSLIGPLMIYADRFVIGALQDAVSVAAYAIPFQIASRTLIFPLSVIQALFPRFAAEADENSQARCRDYSVFVGQIFAPMMIGLICLAGPLMHLWLGGALDPRSIIVAQVVLAGFWFNAVASVPFAFIQARGNPRFTGLLHAAELPFYLLLLVALGTRFGLAGYALAFTLRCMLDCLLLAHKAGVANGFVAQRLLPSSALLIIALAFRSLAVDWRYLLAAALLLSGFAALAGLLAMPDSIRTRLAQLPILRGRVGVVLFGVMPPERR